ncbi:MAG: aminopeptidase P family protein [Phyllobacteriaceae bacterium]|nr:aminopeptidase P family protein [Phyllobacteriaceae bacterium]
MNPKLARRIGALQREMTIRGLDAIVFADRENLIYYAGATEIECLAVVIPALGEPIYCCLWLDAEHVEEATGGARLLPYRFPSSNIGRTIVAAMRELGLPAAPQVGFHKYFVEFAVFEEIRAAFPDIVFRSASEATYRVRAVKDADEIATMEAACDFLAAGMEAAVEAVRPGATELAVLAEADHAMRRAGSEGATFRMQVLTPHKQLRAHPCAGHDVIESGQAIVVHLGASLRGYSAKMCRTVALGSIDPATRRVHDVLHAAQTLAASMLTPGTVVSTIFDAVDALVDREGYGGRIIDHLGYGLGIRQSEFFPIVGKGLDHVLAADMVVDLLLPTILVPGVGGPRITDLYRVAEHGGRIMTRCPRALIEKP